MLGQETRTPIFQENNSSQEKVTLVRSGEDYFLRAKSIILNAKTEIHLQMYIFENDATGVEIINALKEAAIRKTKFQRAYAGFRNRETN